MQHHWERIRKNDSQSFRSLYDELYKALFGYGMHIRSDRELIKECLHELFCELWSDRANLPAVSNPQYYLFTWLKRIILRNVRQQEQLFVQDPSLPSFSDSPEEQHIEFEKLKERSYRLQLALEKLTPKQLQVINLRFYENKSCEEIAELHKSAMRTVYNTLYEAIKGA
ncbi:RNA polymerase sigma factor sigV [Sphingobacterium spiritivorum]|uniref:RNA polymerase sigma factor sigV n=1 Tax=Sphingobacterium spiritivorum TaxID=258 RepID=A0A380BVL5_SPHSI|nr:sigma-70 family RNA polymerase sigma factor [Sphingobacterium spiritivorum]SUJ07857.1 RNA polymerase sigma factor sigV [Sphingobacterium spiritivorum]